MTTPDIELGFFEWREVKRGAWVPVNIWFTDGEPDQDGELTTDQNLCIKVADQIQADPWGWWEDTLCGMSTYDLEHAWSAITESTYRWRMVNLEYSRKYVEADAINRPRQPVDWNNLPPQV